MRVHCYEECGREIAHAVLWWAPHVARTLPRIVGGQNLGADNRPHGGAMHSSVHRRNRKACNVSHYAIRRLPGEYFRPLRVTLIPHW